MATIRRAGFGTVFELEDSKVGIGTDAATHTLQALGNIRSEDATDIGISSLTTYQGFVDKEARFTSGKIDNQSQSGSTSGKIVIDGDVTVSSATTFTSGPQHLSVTDTFTLPSGDTKSRELKPTPGSLRFNQDFATLEFYTGNNWATVNTLTDIKTNPQGRGRALKGCGRTYISQSPSNQSVIEFVNIASLGNAQEFGDCSASGQSSSFSSAIRGFFNGINYSNVIEYVTIASEGDSIDFGDLTVAGAISQGGSSSTRGITSGGWGPSRLNVIDYVEMMTLGNALDFGDLVRGVNGPGATNNSVRKLILGGRTPSVLFDEIMMITIASKGNAVDVGTWTQEVMEPNCGNISNGTRGISAGSGPNISDISPLISSINIDSMGKAIEFGDLMTAKRATAGASSLTRGLIMGGMPHPGNSDSTNVIEFITIASAGGGQDFGDLSVPTRDNSGLSDCHGGLGGF